MLRLLIVARETAELVALSSQLIANGCRCSVIPDDDEAIGEIASQRPDLVLVETSGSLTLPRTIKEALSLPVIALVGRDILGDLNGNLDADDFVVSPYDTRELELRIRRLLKYTNGTGESDELIKCDGLVIDLAKCEVIVDGKVVELTYREYELLRFLASNPGRVYTREALLDKVWGMDYYGGDRTVDVHVRRLRSKIESSGHDFIETVRNIGYRFTKNS